MIGWDGVVDRCLVGARFMLGQLAGQLLGDSCRSCGFFGSWGHVQGRVRVVGASPRWEYMGPRIAQKGPSYFRYLKCGRDRFFFLRIVAESFSPEL
jgi:hypothetical protein